MIVENKIRVVNDAMDALSALRAVGDLLCEVGSASKQYTHNMIASYQELGPYFVIAPEIALAHAKPDESVLQDDIVLMICQSPVTFYSHNDPVTLLFGLCATSGDKHMDNIVMMAELLSDEDVLAQLKQASTANEAAEILKLATNRKE